ncbi:HvfA family oxazolone/thioamide-modified RiPP metallophore [Ectopseudomonas hydrolytica]|jgi:uncharacterized low-complexity protein|uniref:HvfA family oxazolone/thioamide-modified RiPP metallophore n=1 Tax=Ectopseudomonas hydrolytica TaxID=2493633 RepID=UPI0002787D14|nr:hypothetical protein [Pseudomonas hydrolytica]ARS49285.1 EF hand domain-containing protein [Pseudomonas mendocina]EJO94043.1 hypothetical protein A471_09924 [Pseudomonas mendocina DLHK]MBF8164653.1 hypothetical protein [Pseudomonas mendocina]UTH29608.1 hypothetical protein NLY38_14185 [Pseudomonas hydrolytica]
MSRTHVTNKTRLGLIAVALAGGMSLAQASFAVEALPQGYQLASAEKAGEGKCGEGKCGEGKCGTSEAGAKVSQAEGKCGEGKCGDESFARTDSDDDHLVSLAEFLAVAPTRQVEFEEMDTNGDGYLSEAEVYKYRSNQYTSNGKPVPTELFTRMSQAKD